MNYTVAIGLGGMLIALLYLFGSLMIFGRVARRLQMEFRRLKDDVERIDMRYEQLQKRVKENLEAIDQRIIRLNQIAADIKVMKEDAVGLIKKAETVFYIYSDRWTTADTEFLINVQNTGMAGRPIQKSVIQSWTEGRTFIIWAPTAEIANRQMQTRFSVSGGYAVGMTVPSPLGLAQVWAVEASSAS